MPKSLDEALQEDEIQKSSVQQYRDIKRGNLNPFSQPGSFHGQESLTGISARRHPAIFSHD